MIHRSSSRTGPGRKPLARLEFCEAVGRAIRSEDWSELGVPTPRKIQEAIQAGDRQLAIDLTQYSDENNWVPVIHFPEIISATLTVLAQKAGEERLGEALRAITEMAWNRPDLLPEQMSTEDYLAFLVEQRRAMHDQVRVEEEWNRYVLVLDHCNAGGRMARLRGEHGEPYPAVGRTRRGYPWSWGRTGIPYWCCMQAMTDEIQPIERRGRPNYITECRAGERGPCLQYVYKSPDLIPEEFYRRVGCEKP